MAISYNSSVDINNILKSSICYFNLDSPRSYNGTGSNINNLITAYSSPLETFNSQLINQNKFLASNQTNIFSISGSRPGINNENFNFINKTYSFWIYPTDINSLQVVMSYGYSLFYRITDNATITNGSAGLVYISGGKIHASYHGNQNISQFFYSYSTKQIELNKWQNITITSSNQIIDLNTVNSIFPKININGLSADTAFSASNYLLNINYSNQPFSPNSVPPYESVNIPRLHLGNNPTHMRIVTQYDNIIPPLTNGFKGLFGSHFYYINRILSQNEIQNLYNFNKKKYGYN